MSWSRASMLLSLVAVTACGEDPARPPGTGAGGAGAEGGAATSAGGADGGGGSERLGRVFEGTPDSGGPVERPLTRLEDGATSLDGELFVIQSCVGQDCLNDVAPVAVSDAGGDFLYEAKLDPPSADDPAAEVNAYYHFERFAARFAELGFPQPDGPVHVIVGFGFDFDGDGNNDEFLAGATDVLGGPGIVMGIVGSKNLAYDPDVFGHELMHIYHGKSTPALDAFLVPTGLNAFGRAAGEGTADYYACSIMDDPDVGEYSASALGLPYFSSVLNDARCPDGLIGEPHADGQILSGALWEIRDRVGKDRTDAALRDALMDLAPGAAWAEFVSALRDGLVVTLEPDELRDVDAILAARGLPTCDPVVDVVSGEPRSVWLTSVDDLLDPATGSFISLVDHPAAIQLAVDVPSGAQTATIEVETPRQELSLDDVIVHVRAGAPVAWAVTDGALTVESDGSYVAAETMIVDVAATPGKLYVSLASHAAVEDVASVRVTVQ